MCHLYNSVCNEMDSLLDKKESLLFCSRVLIFYVFDLLFWSSFSTAPSNFWCFWPRGRDTWPTEGLRAWLCRTKKSPKLPTLFRTAPSILGPCLEQMIIIPTPLFYTILSVSKTTKRARSRIPKYCVSHIYRRQSVLTIPCLRQVETLFRTDSVKILYPV